MNSLVRIITKVHFRQNPSREVGEDWMAFGAGFEGVGVRSRKLRMWSIRLIRRISVVLVADDQRASVSRGNLDASGSRVHRCRTESGGSPLFCTKLIV